MADTLKADKNMHGFPSFIVEVHDNFYDARSAQHVFMIYLYNFTFSASIVYTFRKLEISAVYCNIFPLCKTVSLSILTA